MVRLPFQRELADLFESDRSIVWKLLGGAVVGVLVCARGFGRQPPGAGGLTVPVKIALACGFAVVGVLVVLLLSFRDVVVRRVDAGKPVNPLLKAYFGRGNGCLMIGLWCITVIFVTMIVTLLTASF